MKAFALYNAAGEGFTTTVNEYWNNKAWNIASRYLGIQSGREDFFDIVKELKAMLKEIQVKLQRNVSDFDKQSNGSDYFNDTHKIVEVIIPLVKQSNAEMVRYANSVIERCIKFLGQDLPCSFTAVGIGSLARGEATPYSDIEHIFLIEDSQHKAYFVKLAVLTYMIICCLKESKLGSMAIKELEGKGGEKGWSVDKRPYGYQIDGITLSSGNVPTRNKGSPGGFIVTPEDLLNEYKCVLDSPNRKDALMGDLTAMFMFTIVLFTNADDEEEKQLSKFIEGRDKLNASQNDERRSINMEMLQKDLQKFTFHPEYDLYYQGFTLHVKKQLYRFPSILLLDLMTILDASLLGPDSWDSAKRLQIRYDSSFVNQLVALLALACFARLRCYLAQDGHADKFVTETTTQKPMPSGAGNVEISLGYRTKSSLTWEMARDEFFYLNQNLLALQHHFSGNDITRERLDKLMGENITANLSPSILASAHYYCCEWSKVLEHLNDSGRQKLSVQSRFAYAYSLQQTGQHEETCQHLEQILQIDRISVPEKLNLLRNLGKCYEELGRLYHADIIYKEAQDICDHAETKGEAKLLKQEPYILLTRGLLLSKQNKYDRAGKCLFRALRAFILRAGTGDDCKGIKELKEFYTLSAAGRLKLIGNQTRELAHCVFAIAEIFQAQGKPDQAHLYFAKAPKLDIDFLHECKTDKVTRMIMLREMGEALKNPKYLAGSLHILEKCQEKDSMHNLSSDVILSILECASHANDHIAPSKELELDLDMEISRIISEDDVDVEDTEGENDEETIKVHKQLFESNRTDSWYRQATNALQKVHPDDYDPRFVKLFKKAVNEADMDSEDIKVKLKTIFEKVKNKRCQLDSLTINKLGGTESEGAPKDEEDMDVESQDLTRNEKETQTDAPCETHEKGVGPGGGGGRRWYCY